MQALSVKVKKDRQVRRPVEIRHIRHFRQMAVNGPYSIKQLPLSIDSYRRRPRRTRLSILISKWVFDKLAAPHQTSELEKAFAQIIWERLGR